MGISTLNKYTETKKLILNLLECQLLTINESLPSCIDHISQNFVDKYSEIFTGLSERLVTLQELAEKEL